MNAMLARLWNLRSRAVRRALEREPRSAASPKALRRQARQARPGAEKAWRGHDRCPSAEIGAAPEEAGEEKEVTGSSAHE